MDPNFPHWSDPNWVPDLSSGADYHPNLTGINLEEEPPNEAEEAPPAHSASKPKKGGRRKAMAFKEKNPAPMPAEGRAPRHTYTLEETDLIVRVWAEETNDAIRGVDQKGDAYWGRVVDRANALLGTNFNPRQIRGHFNRVASEVKLWENVWVETSARWPSGHSDDMLQQKAQVIFQSRSPHSGAFNYWNAWRMLRTNRKFKSMYLEGDVHSTKRTKTSETGDFTSSASAEEITSTRPIGNKAAKAAARAAKGKGKASQSSEPPPEFTERYDKADERLEKILGVYTRKADQQERMHEDRILFMKTDGMDPETLELHKARKAAIIARMRERGDL